MNTSCPRASEPRSQHFSLFEPWEISSLPHRFIYGIAAASWNHNPLQSFVPFSPAASLPPYHNGNICLRTASATVPHVFEGNQEIHLDQHAWPQLCLARYHPFQFLFITFLLTISNKVVIHLPRQYIDRAFRKVTCAFVSLPAALCIGNSIFANHQAQCLFCSIGLNSRSCRQLGNILALDSTRLIGCALMPPYF